MALIYEGPGLREPGLLSFRLLSRAVLYAGKPAACFVSVSSKSKHADISHKGTGCCHGKCHAYLVESHCLVTIHHWWQGFFRSKVRV